MSRPASRLTALIVVLTLLAAACGSNGGDGDGGSGSGDADSILDGGPYDTTLDDPEGLEPVAGGTLRFGLEADVDGLNPTGSALSAPGLTMANAVFDTLAVYTPDGDAVPYLAESFTPNDDATQWTVKVRDGISFHDGTPVNADAVIRSFEAQRGDPLVGLAVRPFFPKENAVEKVDDLSVRFHLLDANRYFPATLTGQLGMVASPTWLDAAAADPTLDQRPVGSGPFTFTSRNEDSVTRFERNADYWNGEVYLDALEFVPVPDPDTRSDLLINGELEGLHTTSAPNIEQLVEADGFEYLLSDTGEESFAMINTQKAPFDDVRARQALTHATPQQDYLDLIGLGILRRADSLFGAESRYHNPDVVQETDQPEKAAPLVEAYCSDNPDECTNNKIDFELQFAGPSVEGARIADLLKNGWAPYFNVELQELPQDKHIEQTATGQYNVVTWRQFGAVEPSNDNVWLLCRTVGVISLNWPRLCDEARDQLLLETQSTDVAAERERAYAELAAQINEAYTYVFFTHTLWLVAFAEEVHGQCQRTTPEDEPTSCAEAGRNWWSSVWIEA